MGRPPRPRGSPRPKRPKQSGRPRRPGQQTDQVAADNPVGTAGARRGRPDAAVGEVSKRTYFLCLDKPATGNVVSGVDFQVAITGHLEHLIGSHDHVSEPATVTFAEVPPDLEDRASASITGLSCADMPAAFALFVAAHTEMRRRSAVVITKASGTTIKLLD